MKPQPIIIVGETFWDTYEDGRRYSGGSGLNVGWNLAGLGLPFDFISRVGNDTLGDELLGAMKRWGVPTNYVQKDSTFPTCIMRVHLDENKVPVFTNPEHVPFDYLDYEKKWDEFDSDSILYFGTFILRNLKSRATIQKLKNRCPKVCMDLNLRAPHWTRELLDAWVHDLWVLKLSDAEAPVLLDKKDISIEQQKTELRELMKARRIENVLLTIGSEGAYWLTQDMEVFSPSVRVAVVDTTGAGDAFFSAIIFSKLKDLSDESSLERACEFAAQICTIKGAVSHDKKFYQDCLRKIWRM